MKKVIIASFFTLLFVISSKAQYYEIYYGAKVGGNLTHLMSQDDAGSFYINKKMMLASHIGAFAEIVFNETMALQPELLYSVKGARFDLAGEGNPKSSYVFKYLSLPIVGKYYVTENISVELGPQVALLLSAKNEEKSDFYQTNLGEELASVDISNDMNIIDVGVLAGVSYLTKSGFYLAARYDLGLTNALKKGANFSNPYKNGAVQLSLGFSFQ